MTVFITPKSGKNFKISKYQKDLNGICGYTPTIVLARLSPVVKSGLVLFSYCYLFGSVFLLGKRYQSLNAFFKSS